MKNGEITNVHTIARGYVFAKVVDDCDYFGAKVLLHAKDRQMPQEVFNRLQLGSRVQFDLRETPQGLKGFNIAFCGHGARHTGTITRLLKNVGFIHLDSGEDAFFRWKDCGWFVDGQSDVGATVECSLIEGDENFVAEKIVRV